MDRVAEDVHAGELRPRDGIGVVMAMQKPVPVQQQLLDGEEEQQPAEDQQRAAQRVGRRCLREDLGHEMDERIAEQRAGGKADEERRQAPHARFAHRQRQRPRQRDRADERDADEGESDRPHAYDQINSPALLHSANDPSYSVTS